MELCIQDPSYNNSKYLHESLLAAFDVALEGGGAYAFATSDGIELLLCDDSFKKFIENGKFQLIVGMDDITNRKALETLKELQARYPDRLSVKAYVHKKHGSTFHPKYSWFKTNDGGLLIIGSGNLTQQGLRQNREAYSIITCDRQTFNAMIEGWKKWVEHSAPFLFDVDDEKVLYLASQNKKKTTAIAEAKRTVREEAKMAGEPSLAELFANQPRDTHMPIRRSGQAGSSEHTQQATKQPLSAPRTAQIGAGPSIHEDENPDDEYWMIDQESSILIAEIPKSGNRWKQANFDKKTFEQYFGATCGENGEYRILLKNIDHNGQLGKTEVRPSVSVSSQNYRFELDAASGLDYPNEGKRPICIFAKVSQRDFLYELIMPNNSEYAAVLAVLNEKEPVSVKMRRLTFNVDELLEKAPNLGVWKRIE